MRSSTGPDGAHEFHYSGVLVVSHPGRLEACASILAARFDVETLHRDPGQQRMIVVLESDSTDGLERRLRQLRSLRDVMLAEPVTHYVDRHSARRTGPVQAGPPEEHSS